jgi:hypothetical protein
MSKDLKLYVVIVMPKNQIMVAVHKSKLFQSVIPNREQIQIHLYQQARRKELGYLFSSIKISLSKKDFEPLRTELSRKAGGSYKSSIIDIVSELGQKPFIQIIQKNE